MSKKVDISKLSKKDKVRWAVRNYITLHADEYSAFKTQIKQKRDEFATQWAEIKGSDTLERALYEMPEILFYGIKTILTKDEWDWLQCKEAYQKNYEGPQWFVTEFKEFRLTKEF